MDVKIVFGKREASSILIIAMTVQLFLNFPRVMANGGGSAGWMIVIYTCLLAVIFYLIISKMYSGFEGKDILDIGEMVFGNTGRIIVGMIIFIDYIFIISIILREYGENLKTIAFPNSPISYILAFFAAGMAIGVYGGMENIARMSAILVPIITLGFAIIIFFSFEYFDYNNIEPILGTGPYKIFVGGIPRISMYSALSLIFLICPYIGSVKNMRKIGVYSILISALFLFIGTLSYLLIFPYPLSTQHLLPVYELARLINIGRFFQRIEAVFVLVWTSAAIIYLCIGMFFSVFVFKKAFKLKYHRPLIIPVTILVFNFSLLPESLMETIKLDGEVFRVFAWTVTFALPMILLILAHLLKKNKKVVGKNVK